MAGFLESPWLVKIELSAALFFWFTSGCAAESSFGLLFCLARSGYLGCCVSLEVRAIFNKEDVLWEPL